MTITPRELHGLTHDAIIELYTLDMNPIGVNTVFRFCNFSQVNGTDVSFGGITYAAIPIEAEGFAYTGRGQLPTPTVRISNVLSAFTPILLQNEDLLGARVTRIKTFAKHLDGGAAPNAAIVSDPDIYVIERKVSESRLEVVFELRSALDLTNVKLPNRLVLSNCCTWEYRSAECGYTGTNYFDKNDVRVWAVGQDRCGKRLRSCELRFGGNQPLPFGGFPGVDNNRFQ